MSYPRKPISQHIRDDTFRRHRHASHENELWLSTGEVGPPPDFVIRNPFALAEWERLTKSPQYAANLSPLFWGLLVEYVMTVARVQSDAETPVTLRRHLATLRNELLLTPCLRDRWTEPARTTLNPFDDVDGNAEPPDD